MYPTYAKTFPTALIGFVLGAASVQIVKRILKLIEKKICHKRVALVLSGCGVYDGSEIQEAVSCLIHLAQGNADVKVFAPDINQLHVINHVTGEQLSYPTSPERNVLVESARISRGEISRLEMLKASDFDAIVFPGGFGAAKNLSTFAIDSAKCSVLPEIERILKDFQSAGKPIALCCISPILAAKVFDGCEVTVGRSKGDEWPYGGTVEAIRNMGGIPYEKNYTEIHYDPKYKIVTAPAYMYAGNPNEIFQNIGRMIRMTLCKA